jgi:hypothetical protein
MRLLIAVGSDVNARTAFGATPLMWSTADIEKVFALMLALPEKLAAR